MLNAIKHLQSDSKKSDPLFCTYIMLNFGTQDDKTMRPLEFDVHEVNN